MNPVIFRIHQSVKKIRLPDSEIRKSTSRFRYKVKVSFGIYKIVGVQEEKRRGAGRRSPFVEFVTSSWPCVLTFVRFSQWNMQYLYHNSPLELDRVLKVKCMG